VIAFDRYYVISGKAQSGVFRDSGNCFYSYRFPFLSLFVWLIAFLLTYPVFYVARVTNVANYSGEYQEIFKKQKFIYLFFLGFF